MPNKPHHRIAQLHRQLAEAYDDLDGRQVEPDAIPTRRTPSKGGSRPASPPVPVSDVDRARAKRALKKAKERGL